MIAVSERTITFEFKQYHLVSYLSPTELRLDVWRDATTHFDKTKSQKESAIEANRCERKAAQAWYKYRAESAGQPQPGNKWWDAFLKLQPPEEETLCCGDEVAEDSLRPNKPR